MATVNLKGGAKLEAALKRIADKLDRPGTLRVGFLEDAQYPDGTNVAMVAAINNFGAPRAGIPPRPFFTNMVKAGRDAWGSDLGKIITAVDFDIDGALRLMGEHMVGQLQDSIRDTNAPELSPVTKMLRQMYGDHVEITSYAQVAEARAKVESGEQGASGTGAKPLIWTSHMLNSVGYEISDK